jgi:ribosomal protein S18 acetylase RimI-like enzyme
MRFDRVPRSQIHATFQEAFSDYTVDMSSLTEERLRIRCAKNNVDWEVSVGAFDGERMVGFTLIGIDRWQGGLGAFDAATGIVRDFRGQGLARRMFDHALPELRRRGVETFVLEVITDNEPAIRAYQKAEFEISRRWRCFGLDLTDFSGGSALSGASLPVPIDRRVVGTLSSATDWNPSWENSFGAIRRIPDDLICLGAMDGDRCVGAIAYSPAMNWIMTLVVEQSHRRQGVGSGLIHALVEALPDEVESTKILNVDASDTGMARFLERLGFQPLIDQYEMIRPI